MRDLIGAAMAIFLSLLGLLYAAPQIQRNSRLLLDAPNAYQVQTFAQAANAYLSVPATFSTVLAASAAGNVQISAATLKFNFPPRSARAFACRYLERNRGSRCRSNFASRTTAPACRRICCTICLIRSLPPNRPEAVWVLRWWQRLSAIMAASSNANPNRGRPSFVYCCRCTTPPSTRSKAVAMAFRVRRRMPHR